MFLNEDTLEQIQLYLCKLCLWINCRITATSCSLYKFCGSVHHLFSHLFEKHASVTISSKQQAPYSYHITILMEHIREALVSFEVLLRGKGWGKFQIEHTRCKLVGCAFPLNPYSNRFHISRSSSQESQYRRITAKHEINIQASASQ